MQQEMTKGQKLREILAEDDPEALLCTGYDDAIAGIYHGSVSMAVYARELLVEKCAIYSGLGEFLPQVGQQATEEQIEKQAEIMDEASEYVGFNFYSNLQTGPIIIDTYEEAS